jgi:hypothetical protein
MIAKFFGITAMGQQWLHTRLMICALSSENLEKTPPTLPGRPSGVRGGDDDDEMEGM